MAHTGILRQGIFTSKSTIIRSPYFWSHEYRLINDYSSYISHRKYSLFKNLNGRFHQISSASNLDRYVSGKILENKLTVFVKPVTTTLVLEKKKSTKGSKEKSQKYETEDDYDESFLEDPAFETLRSDSKALESSDSKSGVMVLQPWVKWGTCKKRNTSGELMLDEAVALVSTLPGVHVIAKEVVPVRSLSGKTIFGSGTLERVISQARSSKTISCVFISVDMMKKFQIIELEKAFGLKVLDRYSVVLSIFRYHARTKEAKLQVALAELPYIRKRMSGEAEHLMVMEREKKLKAALIKLARVREVIRRGRAKSDFPTVAVVGYTNAGKTSLIHSITGDNRAEGKNHLFATLDVTAHGVKLPCGVEVAFIDTIGFIQDIPTDLIASFRATLEDAIYADVVVHVRDASHPDYELQGAIVTETLGSLPLPEKTPIITVANKIDLGVAKSADRYKGLHLVSALTREGIRELLESIQNEVIRVTGRRFWRFSLPTGSDQIRWLQSISGLAHEEIDQDNPQTTHILAVLTDQELALFRRNLKNQE
ncbi:putative GTP-binding protein 6 [Panulirus ornatus]|uniref:putative GTP-binding protein 6 n=1 Tax=Panulirus ornatus TaxID=150431 RepID=UPI003A849C27